MATNVYLERLGQLNAEKESKQAAEWERRGIPINRPLNRQQPGMAGNPNPNQKQPQQEGPDTSTPFGMNMDNFKNESVEFNDFMGEFQKMAMGFGEQVRQGIMPEPIAKQRLEEYLKSSNEYFKKRKPNLMDNPQVAQAAEQLLMQAHQKQGADPLEQGAMAQGMPQGNTQQMPNHEQAGPAVPHGAAPQQGGPV